MIAAWVIFIIILLLLIIFSKLFINNYLDPTESYMLINFTITISLTISMICIFLIPIDVFVVTQ